MSTPTTSSQARHDSNMLKRPSTVRTVQDIKDHSISQMSEALDINDVLNNSDSDDHDYMPDCFMEISSDEESDFEDIGIGSKRVELDSGEYLYDINNPKIFMPKASTGTKRVQNQKHCCFKCKKMVLHLGDHLKIHRNDNDTEINAILENKDLNQTARKGSSKAKTNERLLAQELYRNRGDHRHNKDVLRKGEGELIVSRRPSKDFSSDDYGPCPKCLLWVSKVNLLKHLNKCVAVNETDNDLERSVSRLSVDSDILADRVPVSLGEEMKNKVLGHMKDDSEGVYRTLKADPLILHFGQYWWKRTKGHELNKRRYVSEKMRRVGRLLLCARKLLSASNAQEFFMWDFLRPKYFDLLVEAAIKITTPDDLGTEDYMKSPSTAIKMKYHLQRMCREKAMRCAKKADETEDDVAKKKYMEMHGHAVQLGTDVKEEWRFKVTSLCETMLTERQLDKIERLPVPDDLLALNVYLTQKCSNLDLDKTSKCEQFQENCQYIMSRLYVFNRRRPIEVAGILVGSYRSRSTSSNVDEVLVGKLSKSEAEHFNSLDMLKSKGKGNQIVPVLIPPECQAGLQWIADEDVRMQAGVSSCKYMFASGSKSNPVLSPNENLRKCAEEAGLTHPERLGGNAMRHYMATVTQTLSLTDFQFQHVLKHFGHTRKVHLENYRLAAPVVERLEVGKILMMQDRNVQHLFKDKALTNVTFAEILSANSGMETAETSLDTEDNIRVTDEDEAEESGKTLKPPQESKSPSSSIVIDQKQSDECEESSDEEYVLPKKIKLSSQQKKRKPEKKHSDTEEDSDGTTSEEEYLPKKIKPSSLKAQSKKKRSHVSWKDLQKELHEIFAENYRDKKTPKRQYVSSRLIRCNASSELKSRGPANIVKKLSADINKLLRLGNKENE